MAATPLELVRLAAGYLGEKGVENPRLDAEVLLADTLGVPRIQLYLQFDKPLETGEVDRFRERIRRRGRREPTAYITGKREFWSLELRVDRRVLIPRPETESLVEAVLRRLPEPGAVCRLLDLGTGSGAIALALLSERPRWTGVGTDRSAEALEVARENAERLGLLDRFEVRQGDLFAPVRGEEFDLIVSNPPYVATEEIARLAPEVSYEPRQALDGGPEGLHGIRAIAAEAPCLLTPEGWLALEIGQAQGPAARAILEATGGYRSAEILDDFSGHPRVVVARRA